MNHYSTHSKPLARSLRNNQTQAESLLWSKLKRKQLLGLTFNREKPIANYIVDFYCFSKNLVIELDGSHHHHPDAVEYDNQRTNLLNALGLTVIRFDNRQVLTDIDAVLAQIVDAVRNPP